MMVTFVLVSHTIIYHLSVVCLIKDLVIFNQNELKLLVYCHDVFLLCRLFPSAFS